MFKILIPLNPPLVTFLILEFFRRRYSKLTSLLNAKGCISSIWLWDRESLLRLLSTSNAFDGTFVKLLPPRYKQSRFLRCWKPESDILKILLFNKSNIRRTIILTKVPLPRAVRWFLCRFKYWTETRSLNTHLGTKETWLDCKRKFRRLESPSNIPGSKCFTKLLFKYRKYSSEQKLLDTYTQC